MKGLLFILSLLVLSGCSDNAGPARPNIVLIMADDLGIEGLGSYGGSSYETPHLDRLASQGVRFTHAYSQPLCTPTRVQIMTGKYNHRNWKAFGILDPAERTFGHLLKEAGYRTAIAGKWQLQSYDPPDFPNADKRRGMGMKVEEAGFDEYALFHTLHTEDKGSRYANPTVNRNGALVVHPEGSYGPALSVEFILDFMRRHREEPVFVYFPMSLPHWPFVPTPDSEEWTNPERRLEESTDYFPDMVRYMDKAVGQLVEGLEASGLRENTILLFYSDNGTDQRITSQLGGDHVQGGKATSKQTGIRVPLIVNGPEWVRGGQISTDLVDASDFLPTLADLAGTSIPADWHVDGVSFAPTILGTEGSKREWCFFWYDPRPGWDKERFKRHVFALDHRYKLFSDGRLFDISGSAFKEVELDPDQLTPDALAARDKLRDAIEKSMQGPISETSRSVVNAFGDPIE